MSGYGEIEATLRAFSPITLEEMQAVRLMNRLDCKYLMARGRLAELLERIAAYYHVQRIDGEALAGYRNLYFDTEGLEMYTQHHNRKLTRQKVRIRTYLSSKEQLTFFEIKNKNNRQKTRKIRVRVARELFDNALSDNAVQTFIAENTPYRSDALREQLENRFDRITLVDKGFNERVTIDSDITFRNRQTDRSFDLSELAILEVKHEAGAPVSPIEQALQAMRVQPRRVSKYCIGTVFTNPDCKYNRFKPKVRHIDTLTGGQCSSQRVDPHLFGIQKIKKQ